jgi:hypothetical protein
MTDDEKYEIATLASEADRTRRIFEAHKIMNTPTDPVVRERAMIEYTIAQTEFFEAAAALSRAQARIATKATR